MTRIQGIPDVGPGLRLHLNENTGGCSAAVVEAVRRFDGTRLATYPDFRDAVLETAAWLGVDPDGVLLTNGLDEGILLTAVGYLPARTPAPLAELGAPFLAPDGPPEVVVAVPAFETYISTARAMAARVVTVPPGPDYAYPVDEVVAAITPRTRLVYVNNPNNPTGAAVSRRDIRRVIEASSHALVFLDEAYHDFIDGHSAVPDAGPCLEAAERYPNVIVGRTFSKAHGLAGMRVGVMIARPALLDPIRAVTPLFNVNVVAIAALRAALTDRQFMPWYLEQVAESKRLLYAALDRFGLRYWKSATNFILIDGGERARLIVDGLVARKVFVRDRIQDPYCPNCFRLTTGTVADTQAAIAALEDLCGGR